MIELIKETATDGTIWWKVRYNNEVVCSPTIYEAHARKYYEDFKPVEPRSEIVESRHI